MHRLLRSTIRFGDLRAIALWAVTVALQLPLPSGARTDELRRLTAFDAARMLQIDVELSPNERAFLHAGETAKLSPQKMLPAALTASGVIDEATLRDCTQKFARWCEQLRASGQMSGSELHRAQVLFEFLHAHILTGGYRAHATDLICAFEAGQFNCVSSAVLFNCLAAEFGLDTSAIELPTHVFSQVITAEGPLDVETTCPAWFTVVGDLSGGAELMRQVTGLSEDRSTARRPVSDVQLLGVIYYNRGVDLLAEGRYQDAIAANLKALLFDPASSTAWGNLLAAINNGALAEGDAGNFAAGLALLQRGQLVAPNYAGFQANQSHLLHAWVAALCRQGQFEQALQLLALPAKPSDVRHSEQVARQRLEVYRQWGWRELDVEQWMRRWPSSNKREAESSLAALRAAVDAVEAATVNSHAIDLATQGQYEMAIDLLDRELSIQPANRRLTENRRAIAMRWAAEAFDAVDYAEAIRRSAYGAAGVDLHPDLRNNIRVAFDRWLIQLSSAGRLDDARLVLAQAQSIDGSAPLWREWAARLGE